MFQFNKSAIFIFICVISLNALNETKISPELRDKIQGLKTIQPYHIEAINKYNISIKDNLSGEDKLELSLQMALGDNYSKINRIWMAFRIDYSDEFIAIVFHYHCNDGSYKSLLANYDKSLSIIDKKIISSVDSDVCHIIEGILAGRILTTDYRNCNSSISKKEVFFVTSDGMILKYFD